MTGQLWPVAAVLEPKFSSRPKCSAAFNVPRFRSPRTLPTITGWRRSISQSHGKRERDIQTSDIPFIERPIPAANALATDRHGFVRHDL